VRNGKIRWIGCSNELDAAYAADGYAHMRGCSMLMTTYAVGELSALNGVMGAKAERSCVFHLVGMPTMRNQRVGKIIHHTLGDGIFQNFANISAQAACVSAPFFNFADAFLAYRQGRFKESAAILNGDAGRVLEPAPGLVLAMDQFQLGKKTTLRRRWPKRAKRSIGSRPRPITAKRECITFFAGRPRLLSNEVHPSRQMDLSMPGISRTRNWPPT